MDGQAPCNRVRAIRPKGPVGAPPVGEAVEILSQELIDKLFAENARLRAVLLCRNSGRRPSHSHVTPIA